MKRKATIICMCDKAGNTCQLCAQYHKINPDHIFENPKWTWKGKTFKRVK